MDISPTPFYFIRHGETDWNRRHIYMGSTDIPLNQTGIDQAVNSVAWLKDEPIEHIVTSPLSRASKTAEIIAAEIKKPITVIDDLKECYGGNREGKPVDDGTLFQLWLKGESQNESEAVYDFESRIRRGLVKALSLPGSVLIVSHGGVYLAIQRIFGWPLIDLKNCAPLYHQPPDHPNHPWQVCDLSRC